MSRHKPECQRINQNANTVFLGREDNYSIDNLLDKDISLLTFKALNVNDIAPNYLCSKIQMTKNCLSHNTRRAAKNHLQIPSSNTKFGMRTFAYRASKLWNDLPNELYIGDKELNYLNSKPQNLKTLIKIAQNLNTQCL